MRSIFLRCLPWTLFATAALAAPATGPLRALKNNPRYFTDGSGKAIYLAGSHNWHNFEDNGHRLSDSEDPPPKFDYNAYLDFLAAHHHNFFRLWRWEAPKWTDEQPKGVVKYCAPHPWLRTGPDNAADGKPKFDLTRFNPEYFDSPAPTHHRRARPRHLRFHHAVRRLGAAVYRRMDLSSVQPNE